MHGLAASALVGCAVAAREPETSSDGEALTAISLLVDANEEEVPPP